MPGEPWNPFFRLCAAAAASGTETEEPICLNHPGQDVTVDYGASTAVAWVHRHDRTLPMLQPLDGGNAEAPPTRMV